MPLVESADLERRKWWVENIATEGDSFERRTEEIEAMLKEEVAKEGTDALLSHLRLCGAVPEHYGTNSSEEKLYARYTDCLVATAFSEIGMQSGLISERADAADVHAVGGGMSLVADAKAFRLSRSAKNQKDFKITALGSWRGEADYAILVCPIYQLPQRSSQIYMQAVSGNVCILSFTHMAAIVDFATRHDQSSATTLLKRTLDVVAVLQPGKSALDYWAGVNGALVEGLGGSADPWTREKTAALEGLQVVKQEAVVALRRERTRLSSLSREDAVQELIRNSGVDQRLDRVQSVSLGPLLD